MRPLILGDGQLATEIKHQTYWDIVSRRSHGIDFTDPESYRYLLNDKKFDIIINCIAYTNTMDNVKEKHWNVNYTSVMDLVDMCNFYNKKLIHISTDYIYTNSKPYASEEDVPVHVENWYTYCKLLADGYVQARSKDYLLIRTSFRPRPFPFPEAWLDHMTSADYVDVIAENIIKLIEKESNGVFNVGTEMKTLLQLAKETNPDCRPMLDDGSFKRPKDVTMNVNKLKKELNEFLRR